MLCTYFCLVLPLAYYAELSSYTTHKISKGQHQINRVPLFSYSFIFFDILLAKYTNGVSARLVTINIT